ncbi:glycine receptor subunit alpha-2-like [Argiope bruennichi]|uniref:glycine receptor subunit alpha-2-like n=1 Tax=Argiope bruennichi TaxID=94029 RepID=UPI002494F71A|nr:glycine receptor subunit alpha-2-like [Argiope bruennichi]
MRQVFNQFALFWLIQSLILLEVSPLQSLDFNTILPPTPEEYDNLQPPKEDDGTPTIVRFHVTVLSIDSIDEGSMTYVADIFMSQSWKDYRLQLPENMTSKYRLLPLSWLKKMWRPDSFFKNAKKVTFQEMTIPNHYIWLYSDKTILYMVKLTLELSCAMKFEAYPHDTQTCSLKMESLSYTTDDLIFDWEPKYPLVVEPTIELPQHILVETKLGDCMQEYSTGNFTCIEVMFTLERRLGYYLFHTYIPTCLIVIMSWISFWIRADAVPARVTLCVTSLLTLATQHAQSQKSLPPVSYIKAIDIFMSTCTLFVFSSLMEYAIVNIVIGQAEEREKMANTIMTEVQMIHMESQTRLPNGTRIVRSPSLRRRSEILERQALKIDKVSRIIFPVLFVILNIAYWSYYLR